MTDIGFMIIVAIFVVLIFSFLMRKMKKQRSTEHASSPHTSERSANGSQYRRGASDDNGSDSDGGGD